MIGIESEQQVQDATLQVHDALYPGRLEGGLIEPGGISKGDPDPGLGAGLGQPDVRRGVLVTSSGDSLLNPSVASHVLSKLSPEPCSTLLALQLADALELLLGALAAHLKRSERIDLRRSYDL